MPPKADPYNTRLHRRIDVILFAVVFAIVAILLSTSANAQKSPLASTLVGAMCDGLDKSATHMRIMLDAEVEL